MTWYFYLLDASGNGSLINTVTGQLSDAQAAATSLASQNPTNNYRIDQVIVPDTETQVVCYITQGVQNWEV